MNIIYIHTHDSGRVLSPYGYAVPTPNLEVFTKDATLFRNCYCAGPTCSPSRAAMLTGQYPHQTGMLGLAQRGFSMDYKKHLVQHLNSNGYHTVLCGIQHEAGWYLNPKEGAATIGYQEEISSSNKGYRQEDLVCWDRDNAEQVCNWLTGYDGAKPFFLSYGMYATHRRFPEQVDAEIHTDFVRPPYPIPDDPVTREDFARYMTSAKSADGCFGKVVDCLKKQNLLDNTLVLFTTDHGLAEPFCKCTLYDDGIGVALILRHPNMEGRGTAVDGLVSHVDIFPTLCEAVGIDCPAYVEGTSILPMLKNREAVIREEIFAEVNFHTSYEPIRCVRTKEYKYIRYYDETYLRINASNVDESPTKDYFNERGLEEQTKYREALYNLVFDMGERYNLAEDPHYLEMKCRLQEKLNAHQVATADPLYEGNIPILPTWKVNRAECRTASSNNPDDYISPGT